MNGRPCGRPPPRIVVGLDGSAGAWNALRWAVRLAARRDATVLAVTAWSDADRARSRRGERLRADRETLDRMQVAQIAAATAGLPRPPRIARELVFAEVVTALCHGAAAADLVVLGADRDDPADRRPGRVLDRQGVAGRLAARLAARKSYGRQTPPIVVATAAEVLVPPPRYRPSTAHARSRPRSEAVTIATIGHPADRGTAAAWAVSVDGRPGPLLDECLRAAIAAPSVHNTQPWRFRLRGGAVEVLADPARGLSVTDPGRRELTISVGAAVLNLRVAMLARGRVPVSLPLPDPAEPDLLARVTPGQPARDRGTAQLLNRAIPRRRTNRRPFLNVPVPPAVTADLVAAAEAEGCRLAVLAPRRRDDVLRLVRAAEERRRADPTYLAELKRWTGNEPGRRDGVPPAAWGPPPASLPLRTFGPVAPVHRRSSVEFEEEPMIAVLYSRGDDPAEWLRAGGSMERVLLTATVHGLASTPMTQPVELPDLRDLLADRGDGVAQAVIRFGYGPLSPPTPRRELADVLITA
ncbi:MAG TPA: universal stress protein [Micromonosporaceae bacterium]|nr:universal stress protein [Micromonosporaceae bacterium]